MATPYFEYLHHHGAEILLVDFSPIVALGGTSPKFMPAARAGFDAAEREVARHEPGSLLILNDFAKAPFNNEIAGLAKHYGGHNTPFIKASAVIGVGGLHRIIINSTGRLLKRTIKCFDSRTAALNWLAEQNNQGKQ